MGESERQAFAYRLRDLRKREKLNQKEFAARIGISAASLSAYELGKKSPVIEVAIQIAKEFKVSLNWLCGLNQGDEYRYSPDSYEDALHYLAVILTNFEYFIKYKYNEYGSIDIKSGKYIYGEIHIPSKALSEYIDVIDRLMKLYHSGNLDKSMLDVCINKAVSDSDAKLKEEYDELFKDCPI